MKGVYRKRDNRKNTIQPTIGKGLFPEIFGGEPFMKCVVEMVKNCEDWDANDIFIYTNIAKNLFRIVDNGTGMNKANRNAFSSVNATTAHDPRQSGHFCTGTKKMLYSQATEVTVRTVSTEEPNYVYIFTLNTDTYEEILFNKGDIKQKKLKKTKENWCYDFPYGTEISYVLRDPRRSTIIRNERLAKECAARLPRKYESKVRVNNNFIPEKEIIGEALQISLNHLQLGEVSLEIYRPAKKASGEELLLTGSNIGEVPIINLSRLIKDIGEDIPGVYLLKEVCGTIIIPFFKYYAKEDRFVFKDSIADDPLMIHFIRLLQDCATEVEKKLKLQISFKNVESGSHKIMDKLAQSCNKKYGIKPPETMKRGESDNEKLEADPENKSDPDNPNSKVALSISEINRKEHELGELIVIKPKIRKDIRKKYKVGIKDIVWHLDRANAELVEQDEKSVTFKAKNIGQSKISADIKGLPYFASVPYDIVAQRIFKISIPAINTTIGRTAPVITRNSDKIEGNLIWEMEGGSGELTPQGKRAIFKAVTDGVFIVKAYDSANPKREAFCEISVTGKPKNLICIRGEWFEYSHLINKEGDLKPVDMRFNGHGAIHPLFINQNAPGYEKAYEDGVLNLYLAQAIAVEFASFEKFHLGGIDLSELTVNDMKPIFDSIQSLSFKIMEEINR